MKKFLKALTATVACLIFLIVIAAGAFAIFYTPSLTADLSTKTGSVTTGASGYLYGLAEEGVPSYNMTESIDISSVSAKVPNGLQHPIGDLSHVYPQIENADYYVVYLQDSYSTWYYEYDDIEKQRSQGTYDWHEFVENDFLPRVRESVQYLSSTQYSDKVVYCLYNECDNGVWFGETKQSEDAEYGVYGEYNDTGAANFFEAWKMTYDLVKSINPNALIGGPGFCDYDSDEIYAFLSYCTENDCVPEIMIYHELNDSSVYHWQSHVSDYRNIEAELGISELQIIVTEYGRMQDNGMPGKMLQYITQIETSKVYADNAYWRLANNLCDVSADDNSPNSNWWLYRWYADMQGETVDISYQDLFKSNFGKAVKGEAELSSKGFMGLVTISDDESMVDIICGGRDGSAVVKLKNINATDLYGKTVKISIDEVVYKGISGVVDNTVNLKTYYKTLNSSKLVIDMNDMDEADAYHITVEAVEEAGEDYENDIFIERFEFENGEILGDAYTYDSAYATTGEIDGMVGGIEKDGDGVALTFEVPSDGYYNLDFIYGNGNDGEYDDNNMQSPDDRTNSVAALEMEIDGGSVSYELTLPNTIKSEYTDFLTLSSVHLKKGKNKLVIKHLTGTFVLDSLVVSSEVTEESIAVLPDADRTTGSVKSYLVVAPEDGYYYIEAAASDEYSCTAYVNSNKFDLVNTSSGENDYSANSVYLMRGLNYIDIEAEYLNGISVEKAGETVEPVAVLYPKWAKLNGSASVKYNASVDETPYYIDGISCKSGSAEFTVNAQNKGTYALTITYANNDEGGKHDYNVDLIERYVTVTAGGKSQDVYCRSTYSWDTYKTVTCYVDLEAGDNTITLSNSGNNKFDNQDTYAPYISKLTVNEISL